jgi:hypothetical protein
MKTAEIAELLNEPACAHNKQREIRLCPDQAGRDGRRLFV